MPNEESEILIWNCLGLDADGCLMHTNFLDYIKNKMKEIKSTSVFGLAERIDANMPKDEKNPYKDYPSIFHCNLTLVEYIQKNLSNAILLEILSFSARQTLKRDFWGAQRNLSPLFTECLPRFTNGLIQYYQEKKIKQHIYYDPSLFSDLFYLSNKQVGITHKGLTEFARARGSSWSLESCRHDFSFQFRFHENSTEINLIDSSKLLWVLYTALLKSSQASVEQTKRGQPIQVNLYCVDDNLHLLLELFAFFRNEPKYLPKNIHLHLLPYGYEKNNDTYIVSETRLIDAKYEPIEGTGEIVLATEQDILTEFAKFLNNMRGINYRIILDEVKHEADFNGIKQWDNIERQYAAMLTSLSQKGKTQQNKSWSPALQQFGISKPKLTVKDRQSIAIKNDDVMADNKAVLAKIT